MVCDRYCRAHLLQYRKEKSMNEKRKAPQVGRPYGAVKAIVIHDHVLIIKGRDRIVKCDLERWFYILGGLAFGAGIMAMSIMIPILLGGY